MTLADIWDYGLSHAPSIGAFITAALSLVNSIRNGKRLNTIKIEINGRMTRLLDEAKLASHAEGYVKGKLGIDKDLNP